MAMIFLAHAQKSQSGLALWLHSVLSSALDESEWSNTGSDHFTPR